MNEETQQKYALLQMIDQQVKQTQRQIKSLRNQQEDLLGSMQALNDITIAEIGSEILVPVTNGIFVRATLQEKETVTVNIGAQVAVQKTILGAKHLLEEQFKEVENVLTQLIRDAQELAAQGQHLEQELVK